MKTPSQPRFLGLPGTVILLVCVCMLVGLTWYTKSANAAEPARGELRSYALGNVRAGDIAPTLTGLLPPEADVMVDDRLNRILVAGPPQLHTQVQGAINSLDRIRVARAPAPPAAAPASAAKAKLFARTSTMTAMIMTPPIFRSIRLNPLEVTLMSPLL